MLDPLTKAKSWLTIEEAAKVLGKHFGQEVSKTDIYRYAYEEKLELAIYFNQNVKTRMFKRTGEFISEEQYAKSINNADNFLLIKTAPNFVKRDFAEDYFSRFDEKEEIFVFYREKCISIDGLDTLSAHTAFNLPIIINVGNILGCLANVENWLCDAHDSLWLRDAEYYYRIPLGEENSYFEDIEYPEDLEDKGINIVCVPSALEAFITSLLPPKETEKLKKSSSKTINTQNKVIAALVLYILKDNQDLCDNLITGKDKHKAAKEIKELVENEIVKSGISSFISIKTLAEYISEGIDQLKP